MWLQKARCNANAASASATRSVTADTHPGSSLVGASSSPVDALRRRSSLSAVAAGENHTANYRGCVKWKEAKGALAKQAPERSRKSVATGQPSASKSQLAGPSAEQLDLGEGWNHVFRGGVSSRLPRLHPPYPHPNPPQPVT